MHPDDLVLVEGVQCAWRSFDGRRLLLSLQKKCFLCIPSVALLKLKNTPWTLSNFIFGNLKYRIENQQKASLVYFFSEQ